MLRLFVGIALPDHVRDELHQLERGIPGARWIDPKNYHITLRFIGDVDEGVADDLHVALSDLNGQSFELEFANVGYFGKLRKAHSVWADIVKSTALEQLQSKVVTALQRAGLEPDKRKFKPHVTLALIKGETGHHLANFLAEHGTFRLPPFTVDQFTLFSSHLSRKNAHYEALCDYRLSPAASSGAI